ncbi:hypothetical protein [Paraburkholderia sp.]|uniref:hypothetical protein n=1 Tax=Paraburkholderia sp. TaxID=1926495 RepID=UPI0023880F3C|nr:hypothetical protein [Paraburkholderia sp.]MDE1179631.1 hypothetical protein [Paraburkholderia sp.]
MYRLFLLTAGLLMAGSALAGSLAADGPSGASAMQIPAAADKVYPPLPTLAMLPPGSADDTDPLPSKPATRFRKKSRASSAPAQERRIFNPAAKLVVSDASRAYLDTIGRQLELALNK